MCWTLGFTGVCEDSRRFLIWPGSTPVAGGVTATVTEPEAVIDCDFYFAVVIASRVSCIPSYTHTHTHTHTPIHPCSTQTPTHLSVHPPNYILTHPAAHPSTQLPTHLPTPRVPPCSWAGNITRQFIMEPISLHLIGGFKSGFLWSNLEYISPINGLLGLSVNNVNYKQSVEKWLILRG